MKNRIVLIIFAALACAALWQLRRPSLRVIAAPSTGQSFALRVTFGHRDAAPRQWDGRLEIEGGKLVRAEGWRTWEIEGDEVLSTGSWRLRSRRERRYGVVPEKVQSLQYWEEPPGDPSPSGVFFFGEAPDSAQFRFQTSNGDFAFRLADIAWGRPAPMLGGDVEVARMAFPARLSPELQDNDFPTIAVAPDGAVWAAWQSYVGGHDEIYLARHEEGKWKTYSPLPGVSGDVWRPQVAVDASGTVWVVWSQQEDGNWDLYAMAHRGNRMDSPVRLTHGAGPDMNARVATDKSGRLFVVWQGAESLYSRIYLRYHEGGRWSERVEISPPGVKANHWTPAVATDSKGTAHVVWDTYQNGSYDVYLRSFSAPDRLGAERVVAATPRYEAHASVACDSRDRVWVAWESGLTNWGKDLVATAPSRGPGTALGDNMEVKLRVFDGASSFAPVEESQSAFVANERSRSRYPELVMDSEDRPWLVLRHITLKGQTDKHSTTRGRGIWAAWVTTYSGGRWTRAELLPSSDGRISSFAHLAPVPGGGVWAIWNGDKRPFIDMLGPTAHNQVWAGYLGAPVAAPERLGPYVEAPAAAADLGQRKENVDVARVRSYRASVGGRSYSLVRGDLHRHAELSRDQGGSRDGSILDFYRYMLDAAQMDFGALTEHSNGFIDYWNWLIEKTCDLYNRPGYTALYAYERTVTYPFGHRNVIHARRGVPMVDIFTKPSFDLGRPSVEVSGGNLVDNDTTLLHQQLRRTGGIAIAHTIATSHGTDWSQYDAEVEPVAEIYQGLRHSYERIDGPRALSPKAKDFREPGLLSNAWAKGHRLGVIASSDHVSTHTSYAFVYTPSAGRQDLLDSIKSRHTYGATDNILLDCRVGDHLMGDQLVSSVPVAIRVKAHGTGAISRVSVIKDNVVVYAAEPKAAEVDLTYRDNIPVRGKSFYYVRLEQADGELAWSSPFWVREK